MPITGTLPALSAGDGKQNVKETINQLVKQLNRQDAFRVIYGADTGTATAFAIAPTPGIKFYRVGQVFLVLTSNANSGAGPTLNVNGCGAGTITWPDGTALSANDIGASALTLLGCASTTPTFHLLSKAH